MKQLISSDQKNQMENLGILTEQGVAPCNIGRLIEWIRDNAKMPEIGINTIGQYYCSVGLSAYSYELIDALVSLCIKIKESENE